MSDKCEHGYSTDPGGFNGPKCPKCGNLHEAVAALRSRLSAVEMERDNAVFLCGAEREKAEVQRRAFVNQAEDLAAERDLFKAHCEAMAEALPLADCHVFRCDVAEHTFPDCRIHGPLARYRKDSTP